MWIQVSSKPWEPYKGSGLGAGRCKHVLEWKRGLPETKDWVGKGESPAKKRGRERVRRGAHLGHSIDGTDRASGVVTNPILVHHRWLQWGEPLDLAVSQT